MELKYIKKLCTIPYAYCTSYTAVSTKVVPQKRKLKAYATMPIGIMGRRSLAPID